MIPNPDFSNQRIEALKEINYKDIDYPIIDLIKDISHIDYCFSLQCCYGHFIYTGQNDIHNIEELPITKNISKVDYRIAYLSICIQKCQEGKNLLSKLKEVQFLDRKYIQFGCAEWFWERQINSFVLQVEPERFMYKDRIYIGYEEARHIEKTRKQFYVKLKTLVKELIS